jgi:hypothetical protein
MRKVGISFGAVTWVYIAFQALFAVYIYYLLGWNALKVWAWAGIERRDRSNTLFELWSWM